MIVSNEPGYYKTGAYGIRIENLVTVIEDAGRDERLCCLRDPDPGTHRPQSGGEEPADSAEIAWLDAYHAACAGP
jgi:Xaa-Pro aminopeptidase